MRGLATLKKDPAIQLFKWRGGGIGRPIGKSDGMNTVIVKDTTLFCLVLAVPKTAMDRFSPL